MDPSGPLKYMILGPLKFKKTKKKDGTTKVHESRKFIFITFLKKANSGNLQSLLTRK